MIEMRINISKNLLTPALQKIRAQINNLPKEIYDKFVDLTPEDTGYAKKNTKLVNNRKIAAQYTYASVLDKGRHMTNRGMRGSNQAPKGMTRPTKEWAKQRIRAILRRKGR
jgi:hypothetical protein